MTPVNEISALSDAARTIDRRRSLLSPAIPPLYQRMTNGGRKDSWN